MHQNLAEMFVSVNKDYIKKKKGKKRRKMENVQPSMLLSNLSIDFCQPVVSVSTIKVQLYSIVYRLKEINNQKSKTK